MLDQMKQKFMDYEELDYRQGEAENLPIDNDTVDCAGGNCCAASNCECDKASISIFVAYGEK